MKRHVPLDGSFNFRDAGGLETRDGRRMKPGILYRSDELSRLSDGDLERLGGLGLRSICDLRAPGERRRRPDRLPPGGVRPVHVPFQPPDGDLSRWQFFWLLTMRSRDLDFAAQLHRVYRHVAFACTAQVREIVTWVSAQENLPAVIHCTAGKDRTGYVVALIQLLAGVPREAVVEDYLVTNRLIGSQAKKYLKFLRWMSLFRISPERFQPLLEVRRPYLERVLDEALERHGSVDGYLTGACGVDPRDLARLKQLLVE